MSNTLKQRKYYAITTKSGKCIPAQRTAPDEVIKHPLHFFYIIPQGEIIHLVSQKVVPVSKHSTLPLLEKRVYEAVAGIPLYRLVSYCCRDSEVETVMAHLNKKFPPHPEFSIDSSKISVEVMGG